MDRIGALYEAFNARDVDAVVAQVAPDVDWPDAMLGTRVVGSDAVRAYWLGQWEVIDLAVDPRRLRDRDGDLLGHAFVLHTYTFSGPLVSRMDVGDPQA